MTAHLLEQSKDLPLAAYLRSRDSIAPMKTIFLVEPSEAELARKMERILLDLPESAGVLFVGVEVSQHPDLNGGRALFKVFVGCTRERDPKLMDAVVRLYLHDLVEDGQLQIEAHRGFQRLTNLS